MLTEIDTERLFCNIPEIYAANRVFWHDYIMPMLTQSRKNGDPLNPSQMKEGFLKVILICLLFVSIPAYDWHLPSGALSDKGLTVLMIHQLFYSFPFLV